MALCTFMYVLRIQTRFLHLHSLCLAHWTITLALCMLALIFSIQIQHLWNLPSDTHSYMKIPVHTKWFGNLSASPLTQCCCLKCQCFSAQPLVIILSAVWGFFFNIRFFKLEYRNSKKEDYSRRCKLPYLTAIHCICTDLAPHVTYIHTNCKILTPQ